MKKILILLASVALLAACQPQKCPEAPTKVEVTKGTLKTQMDKLNYTQGMEIGRTLKRNGLEYNGTIFEKGLMDGMNEVDPGLLTPEEQLEVRREQSKMMMEARKKERDEAGAKNKADGDKFLAENKTKEGVITTESGLQYQIMKIADGPKPGATDMVSVHYVGTLIDGTEFDSSIKRSRPATFGVDRVVKGWTEALQLMPVGSKWKVFVPSELGYGERGAGRQIGPNSVLIFEVELLEINPKEEGAMGGAGPKVTPGKPALPKPAKAVKPAAVAQ